MALHVTRATRCIDRLLLGAIAWLVMVASVVAQPSPPPLPDAVVDVPVPGPEIGPAPPTSNPAAATRVQDPVPAAATPPVNTVNEVAPELFYLRDDAGRLVPVPGFRYRDFIELMRLRDGLPGLPEPPAAVTESISIVVTLPEPVTGATAVMRTCPAELRLTVRQVRAGWVSVPIDLQGFLINGAPVHEGPGQMFFAAGGAAEPSTPRVWFNADSDEEVRHTVIVPGGVPVESSTQLDTIMLLVPPATASRVEIRTPRSDAAVTVRPASLPPVVKPNSDDEAEGTQVTVVGAAGRLEVRIGDRRASEQNLVAVPDVMVESLVRMDGKTAITEATLRLESLPVDTPTLRIRLPARSTLRRVREPAVLQQRSGTVEAPEIVVQVDRDSTGGASVGLECEQTIDASGRTPFDPLGFSVAGIPDWRQRGRVSVMVEGDWQIEWDDVRFNRRIDPPPAARRPGFVASFAYDSQPASLPMRVRPRGSRVVIEPEYRYGVGASRVTLDGRLRVSVRGAAASRLVVALDGWDIEDVGPIGLVDAMAVTTDGKRLIIPFQQSLTGDSVIDFRCSRPIDAAAEQVMWRFPMPEASLLGPAAVLITSETDIELIPDTAAIRGLVRQIAPAPVRTETERLALAYRLDGTDGLFQAQRRFLTRRVDASVRTQVDIDQDIVRVTEMMRFAVAHVPLEFIEFLVPAAVAVGETLEIRQNGQLLNLVIDPVADGVAADGKSSVADSLDSLSKGETAVQAAAAAQKGEPGPATGWSRARAMLPVPLLGAGEVTVTYELPAPEIPSETTVAEDLPLVLPLDTKVGRQTLQVSANDAISIDVRGDEWKRDTTAPVGGTSRSWMTARFQKIAPLALATRRREMSGETIIEAAWLQTRLLADRREDRFAYAISTTADRLVLTLPDVFLTPDGSETTSMEVWLDDRRIDDVVQTERGIEVLLPSAGVRSTALLELRLARSWTPVGVIGLAGLDRVILAPPEFADGVQQRRFYWDVHLPPDRHVLVSPQRWTDQQRWVWDTIGWKRKPIAPQSVIGSWLRANAGDSRDVGRDAVDTDLVRNRLVYSGIGSPGSETLWMAATWLLVLAVSGPLLAIGLLMVYVPAVRSAWLVSTVAFGLALFAAARPGLIPMLIQGALPGVGCGLLAAAMRGLIRLPSPAGQRSPVGSSVSLMRGEESPSLIVAQSVIGQSESVTTPGRSA